MLKYIFWLAVLITSVFLIRFFKKYFENRRCLATIPTPQQTLSIFLVLEPEAMFQKLRELSSTHYPIYRLSTFYVTIVNFLDPRDIEIVLSSTKHLTKSKIYSFLSQWLGTGLLTSTGKKWHQRRKILTPAFHFSILQQFLTIFNEETERLVVKLEEHVGKCTNIVPHITHFALRSISETAMGLGNIDESIQREYRNSVYKMGRIIFKRLATPWLRVQALYNLSPLGHEEKEVVRILHNFSNNIIKAREKESQSISEALNSYSKKKRLAMLDLLLAARAEGAQIDHEGIREEVDTFMFEGHDTTSMAISFILLCLANHLEIQDNVYKEIISVLGKEKTPTHSDLQQLKLTERCIKESLRLFPSVPFISRYASEDFRTKTGHTIPKGTVMHIHIFDVHRCPNHYPDPLKFDPDRFLPERANARHPFAYIPFSAGPRNCIGQRFAMLELKAVLCGILRRFSFEPVDKVEDVKFIPDLVLRPATEIRVVICERGS